MSRRFNTAGPNNPEDHYTLPVLARLLDIRRLIDDKLYFVLHAPRQAGKTTALMTLARELTDEGRYVAVLMSMESGVPFRDDVGMAEDAVLDDWRSTASRRLPPELQPPPFPAAVPGRRVSRGPPDLGRDCAATARRLPRRDRRPRERPCLRGHAHDAGHHSLTDMRLARYVVGHEGPAIEELQWGAVAWL